VNGLRTIAETFEKVDRHLAGRRKAGKAAGGKPLPRSIGRKRKINEQAWFLLAWGQLDADITDACRNIIRMGQSQEKWRDRRAWSMHNPDDRRLFGLRFASRLMLVLERDNRDWKRTMELYSTRNRIAHGNLELENFDMRTAANDLLRIQESFVRD